MNLTRQGMGTFFEPSGVAIIGARRSPGFGYGIPLVLKREGWGSLIYLVNPKGGELHGLPVYRSLAEVPDPVDLAIVIVPASLTPGVMEEIGHRGIGHVILETAGFAEVGEEGRKLQEEVKNVASRHGIRVIGPNCVGVVNTVNRFTTVEVLPEALQPGSTAIIAQSGVFGNVLLDLLPFYGLFISKAATLGNRLDVNECDMLEYFHQDPTTRVIMMYLEGAADGRRLLETLTRVTCDKPVLVLKSGRTSAGRAATASHTASLSGEDQLYESLFRQTGAIRVDTLESLVEMARAFSTQPLPRGNRLGIITGSGSLGVMATDAAVNAGLAVPPLSPGTVEFMRREAPGWMNVRNPLDVGPSNQFARGLEALLRDPQMDMVLAITIIPHAVFREFKQLGLTADVWFGDIASIREKTPEKPLAICAVGNPELVEEVRKISGPQVPVFISPEPAAKALAALFRYRNWRVRTGTCPA